MKQMGVQIGARPDAGFDDPIGMLRDCHRRIEQFVHVLCLVIERAAGRPLTGEEAAAVNAALHYFKVGGQRHNADEEESLFPRMRADKGSSGALKEIETLEAEHRVAGDLHFAVERLYADWVNGKTLTAEEEEKLRLATQRLRELYNRHIQVEENLVFPRAAASLDDRSIAAMGDEFRQRRQYSDVERVEFLAAGAEDQDDIKDDDLVEKLNELAVTTDEEVDALRVNLLQDDDMASTRDSSGRIVDDTAEERMARFTEADPMQSELGAVSVAPGRDDTSRILRRHHPKTSIARSDALVEGNLDEPMDEMIMERKVDEGTSG
jgi:hemerythrin-like domain-containing protein